MAVTKIWDVRNRFDKVLDYAVNVKKTDADIEKSLAGLPKVDK